MQNEHDLCNPQYQVKCLGWIDFVLIQFQDVFEQGFFI